MICVGMSRRVDSGYFKEILLINGLYGHLNSRNRCALLSMKDFIFQKRNPEKAPDTMSFRKPPSDVERMTSLRVGNLPFRTVQEVTLKVCLVINLKVSPRTSCPCSRSTEMSATSTFPSREDLGGAAGLPL